MKQIHQINTLYNSFEEELYEKVHRFLSCGKLIVKGERNIIKKFTLSNDDIINIKSFKNPHLINQFSYQYIRPSKAKRSYYNAIKLEKNKILTPSPIAYFQFSNLLGVTNSYYISKHLAYDFTFRELLNENFPDRENILRQFTRFTYELHCKNIEFLDHSPGNTLIVKNKNNAYDFYLVDLNRMRFKKMTFEQGVSNFKKLSSKADMLSVMSDEYARITKNSFKQTYELMKNANDRFQYVYQRRMRFKARYLKQK